MSNEFIIGQRWISQSEPQLGLGILVSEDGRHITIHYPAIEEDRAYASNNSPLARVIFQAGDSVKDIDDVEYLIKEVEEVNGLYYYLAETTSGEQTVVPESKLSGQIQLSSPLQRLFSGQFDKNRAFQLRAATLHFRYVLQQSKARGLIGPRTDLLGHQVYIAAEVANRFAPRVLLADEVGLGKTIEAGMILHHQLQAGLCSRALIVVPDPLLHQWLVEMLRKFNLAFSLFDKKRFLALQDEGHENPFDSAQLVLCSTDFITRTEGALNAALASSWDMLIVDEAHHLYWNPEDGGSEDYNVIKALAEKIAGLLLLTATPEQAGIESHFARLRLLDPAKFSDIDSFIAEQDKYNIVNDIADNLLNHQALSTEQEVALAEWGIDSDNIDYEEPEQTIRQLLDRHGTGRVLFRNTRSAISGFPSRVANPVPLEANGDATQSLLFPEIADSDELNRDQWVKNDPRVSWLESFLREHKNDKILLISKHAKTAIDLEKHLHLNVGVRSTAFYEGLSIIERDRAAAYFAEAEGGAQVLICSEIGSEGRNFQFAHHLVLFDLPTEPDQLEQRIGRLDRIGQQHDIQIHIPYIIGGAQEALFRWYHQGLDAFTHSFSAGHAVGVYFADRLAEFLVEKTSVNDASFDQLIKDTQAHVATLRDQLDHGRDHLIELNSHHPEESQQLIEEIQLSENTLQLTDYMGAVFDVYGVDQEYHSENSFILRPSEHMQTSYFPQLKDEGVTVTTDRKKAVGREDLLFLTWESPMVTESMDMVLSSELGNVTIGSTKLKALPAGTVLLETFYSAQISAPKKFQIERFLPQRPIRVLIDVSGKNLTDVLKHGQINKIRGHVKRGNRLAIVKQLRPNLEKMIEQSQVIADQKLKPHVEESHQHINSQLDEELSRLRELSELNGMVRTQEIEFYQTQKEEVAKLLPNAQAQLEGIRLLINTH